MRLRGRIVNKRDLKNISFIVLNTKHQLTLRNSWLHLGKRWTLGTFLDVQVIPEENTKNFLIVRLIRASINELGISEVSLETCQNLERLRHRYLYFLTPIGKEMISLRSEVLHLARSYFYHKGFKEIQTPILTIPTEEGARDYLVASRYYPGKHYALAQSPQLYKQICAYGRVRYFQIAPSFRDEDGRADRANGEFYQVDVEHEIKDHFSEVYNGCLSWLTYLFKKLRMNFVLLPSITYAKCIKQYNIDKPDWRIPQDLSKLRLFIKGKLTQPNKDNLIKLWSNLLKVGVVRNYPMFELSNEGNWTYVSNPFAELFSNDVSYRSTAKQFDVVINGVEVCSGGERSTNWDKFTKVMRLLNKDSSKYQFLRSGMNSGISRHGGFGMGIERLLYLIAKAKGYQINLSDVIPFPLLDSKVDPLTGAPS